MCTMADKKIAAEQKAITLQKKYSGTILREMIQPSLK